MGLLFYSKKEKSELTLVALDFYKIFDSVNWEYFKNALHFYEFGNKFNNAILGIYLSYNASIIINNCVFHLININCGTKQGLPFSPLLFILVLEPLANKLRSNQGIRSFKCEEKEHLLTIY